MPSYLVLMCGDTATSAPEAAWNDFFAVAGTSGMFRGGSALDDPVRMRLAGDPTAPTAMSGFMRFEAASLAALQALLERHPWYQCGGTLEIRALVEGNGGQ